MMRRLREFWKVPFFEKLSLLQFAYHHLKTRFFYRYALGSMGRHCVIIKPISLYNARFIHLGDSVRINHGVRLDAIIDKPSRVPELRIGSNVNIEQNVHIICHSRITIGDNVSITGNCAIVDITHPYMDLHDPRPIGQRILDEDSFVEVGEGSFLGFGTVILPNVRIGRHCVIGANSCVTRSVPDYSVATGNPAVVIRHYDFSSERWVRGEARETQNV
jgi:acetyltransferase-like isoleucine patch superfamily enzyme